MDFYCSLLWLQKKKKKRGKIIRSTEWKKNISLRVCLNKKLSEVIVYLYRALLFPTYNKATWMAVCQAMEFPRPEYWRGQLFPYPGHLPNTGIEPRSPALQADSLPSEPAEKLLDKKLSDVIVHLGRALLLSAYNKATAPQHTTANTNLKYQKQQLCCLSLSVPGKICGIGWLQQAWTPTCFSLFQDLAIRLQSPC